MTINGKTVLVTGANRGIGQALVTEALARGASRVYAGTRQPLTHPDARVTPLTLDVTSAAQIQAAAEAVGSLDILINNAGIALYDDLSDRAALDQGAGRSVRSTRSCGPTDTDDPGLRPQGPPESVARAIFDGVENGEEDIFPDPMSQSLAESWRNGAVKAMERENAAFVAAEPAAA